MIQKRYGKSHLLSAHSWINSVLFFVFLFMNYLDDGENLHLQAHGVCVWKYEYVHLVMAYSKVGTDGINISIRVLKLVEDFTIQDKFIARMCDEFVCARQPFWISNTRMTRAHTKNYVSTRFFLPCITRCVQGSRFGFQIQG